MPLDPIRLSLDLAFDLGLDLSEGGFPRPQEWFAYETGSGKLSKPHLLEKLEGDDIVFACGVRAERVVERRLEQTGVVDADGRPIAVHHLYARVVEHATYEVHPAPRTIYETDRPESPGCKACLREGDVRQREFYARVVTQRLASRMTSPLSMVKFTGLF